MTLVLFSWNVHGWIARNGVRDPAHAFEAIRAFDADAVALQEVEGSDWEIHAERLGYRAIAGPTVRRVFGNALLVRQRLASLRRLDLSVDGRERRGALDAVLRIAGAPFRVVATHLGLRPFERRLQAAQLARHIETRDAGIPMALLGDLNDWTASGRQLAPLVRAVGPLSRQPTFPSRYPLLPLDRAACRAPGFAHRVDVIRWPSVCSASDHLALRLQLDPDAADAGGPAG